MTISYFTIFQVEGAERLIWTWSYQDWEQFRVNRPTVFKTYTKIMANIAMLFIAKRPIVFWLKDSGGEEKESKKCLFRN